MRGSLLAVAVVGLLSTSPAAQGRNAAAPGPVVVLTTVKGDIEIELLVAETPKSAGRILELAKTNFYRGLLFHWVQPGVVQVGDPLTRDMTKRELFGTGGSGPRQSVRPIGVAELTKRKFERGTVGLAYRNGAKPEEADCQIFILTAPNPSLNGKYAAIGRVIKGMTVVDKIALNDMVKTVAVR
ncbi:MAG TPA: peptidylprolyl isomerase [Vicinamibacterales bacterium]|nr:peptidylprolyl isomerase [Vicinamibacterales bacterium]